MKNLHTLDRYRRTDADVLHHYGNIGDETCGAFLVPSTIDGAALRIVASSDGGWDHVSMSRKNRCPNWIEMEQIKRLFFEDDETAVQFHVPPSDHISVHPNCLHLWRPQDEVLPRPPEWMVA